MEIKINNKIKVFCLVEWLRRNIPDGQERISVRTFIVSKGLGGQQWFLCKIRRIAV
jgi:hypothetical protein